MSHADFLIRQARVHWDSGQPLPIDLFYQLLGAGLDVTALEATYLKDPQ